MAHFRKRGARWYFTFIDADGVPRERKGCTDRRATEELARAAETEAAKIRAGIIDPFAPHRRRPIGDHAADYVRFLRSKNGTAKHVDLTETRLTAVLDGCGFQIIGDVRASSVSEWLSVQRTDKVDPDSGTTIAGISAATSDHYLQAMRGFMRWLVEQERAPKNPLLKLKPLHDQADRRHDRAALDGNDFAKLLNATRDGLPYRGLSGVDRTALYVLASYTGLRASELASLRAGSFDLDGDPPTVRAEAAYTKDGQVAELPLLDAVVTIFRGFLLGLNPDGPVWPGTWHLRAAQMFRKDLEASGLPYRDEQGRYFDFHSLRHRFGTQLALANVAPKVAQTLMRHSTIVLTMDTYSHVDLQESIISLKKITPPPACDQSHTLKVQVNDTHSDSKPINGGFAEHLPNGAPGNVQSCAVADAFTSSHVQVSTERNSFDVAEMCGCRRDYEASCVSSGGGIRTPDTRIMIPLFDRRKGDDSTGLRIAPGTLAKHLPNDSCRACPELQAMVERWPELPTSVRVAVLTMVEPHRRGLAG